MGWYRNKMIKERAGKKLFISMIACLCFQPTPLLANEDAFNVPDIFEINGWDVSCASGSQGANYSCTMSKHITAVGAFRLTLSPTASNLLAPRCGDSSDSVLADQKRSTNASRDAAKIYQQIRKIVMSCNANSLNELAGSDSLIALLAQATK